MTAQLTEKHQIDGTDMLFTAWQPDLPDRKGRADVLVLDAVMMEHATSLACQLLTDKGLDGEIINRRGPYSAARLPFEMQTTLDADETAQVYEIEFLLD